MKTLRCGVILLAMLLAAVSCGRKERIIPRSTFSKIYADLFIADQWILDRGLSRAADTVLIYEPVFNQYGYTSADFYASVDKYLRDPERYTRMLKVSASIIDERIKELETDNALARKQKAMEEQIRNYSRGYPLHCLRRNAPDTLSRVYVPSYLGEEATAHVSPVKERPVPKHRNIDNKKITN